MPHKNKFIRWPNHLKRAYLNDTKLFLEALNIRLNAIETNFLYLKTAPKKVVNQNIAKYKRLKKAAETILKEYN